jgi:hypothetical protein
MVESGKFDPVSTAGVFGDEVAPTGSSANSVPLVPAMPLVPPNSAPLQTQANEDARARERTIGAGVLSGVIFTICCGPVLGFIMGCGTAYYAKPPAAATEQRESSSSLVRDSAVALGEIALVITDHAKQLDQRHAVVERSQRAVSETPSSVSWVLDRTQKIVSTATQTAVHQAQKHHLLERSVETIGQSFDWIGQKISKSSRADNVAAPMIATVTIDEGDSPHNPPRNVTNNHYDSVPVEDNDLPC